MNYFNFIKQIKSLSLNNSLIKEVGEGDIYEYLNSGTHLYPCVFLTVQTINPINDTLQLSGTLFYVDRTLDNEGNKIEIQSNGITILTQIFDKLKEDTDIMTYPNSFTPFTEKFADLCAGVFCNFNATFTNDVICSDSGFEIKTITLTENGLYDIMGYDKAIVKVEGKEVNAEWGKITGNIEDQTDLQIELDNKQDNLTAGEGITLENNTISADFSTLEADIASKQDKLTAGNNIVIESNVISADLSNVESLIEHKQDRLIESTRIKIIDNNIVYANNHKPVIVGRALPFSLNKFTNYNFKKICWLSNSRYYQSGKTLKIRFNDLTFANQIRTIFSSRSYQTSLQTIYNKYILLADIRENVLIKFPLLIGYNTDTFKEWCINVITDLVDGNPSDYITRGIFNFSTTASPYVSVVNNVITYNKPITVIHKPLNITSTEYLLPPTNLLEDLGERTYNSKNTLVLTTPEKNIYNDFSTVNKLFNKYDIRYFRNITTIKDMPIHKKKYIRFNFNDDPIFLLNILHHGHKYRLRRRWKRNKRKYSTQELHYTFKWFNDEIRTHLI